MGLSYTFATLLIKQKMNTTANRINWIDWAKILLIYFVVVAHYGNIPTIAHDMIGGFHMPAFFMISGYLHKPISAKESLYKNFRRLIVPAILFSCLCWVFYLLLHIVKGDSFDFDEWLIKPLRGFIFYDRPNSMPPCGVVWFLQVLFVCQIAIDVLYRRGCRWLYSFCLITIILTTIMYFYGEKEQRWLFVLQRSVVSFPFVAVGFVARQKHWLDRLSAKPLLSSVLLVLYIIGVCYEGRVDIATWLFGECALLFYLVAFIGCFSFMLAFFQIRFVGGVKRTRLYVLSQKGQLSSYAYIG